MSRRKLLLFNGSFSFKTDFAVILTKIADFFCYLLDIGGERLYNKIVYL